MTDKNNDADLGGDYARDPHRGGFGADYAREAHDAPGSAARGDSHASSEEKNDDDSIAGGKASE